MLPSAELPLFRAPFPIEVATISLVMSFCFEPARDIPGSSTGADTVIPNPFPFSFSPIALALLLTRLLVVLLTIV